MSGGLVVRGYSRRGEFSASDDFAELYGSQVSYRPRRQVTTRAGAARGAQQDVNIDGEDDDILEIETADGLVQFTTVGFASKEARDRGTRQLEELLPGRQGPSPIVSVTRSTFDVLDPDVKAAMGTLTNALEGAAAEHIAQALLDPAARIAMRKIAEWVDRPCADDAPPDVRRKKAKRRGLYKVDSALRLDPDDLRDTEVDSLTGPVLLLLHGTFSHTEGAFGGLRGTDEWAELCRKYGDRMFALEHATLSKTPVENALDAARLLPEDSQLHVVSHSRGGLIGEALTFTRNHLDTSTGFDDVRMMLEKADKHSPDINALADLREVMAARNLSVDRFVRVACPARGTILASRRIDRYASYLFNALRLIPGVQGTGVLEAVKLLLLTFLNQRADVRAVPGLAAQMPESPFIAVLNARSGPEAKDNMAVIAGDVEGSGLFKRLRVLGADLFFRKDHDMVVNTDAMVCGVPRKPSNNIALFKGPAYSHANYFTDHAARGAVARWLLPENPENAQGFARSLNGGSRGPARGLASPKLEGTVLVVPDLMGSEIRVDGKRCWPDPAALSGDGLEIFLKRKADWTDAGLVTQYDRLISALGSTARPFSYIWCEELSTAAGRLNNEVAEVVKSAPDSPVHIVAHGTGCRVVLAAAAMAGSSLASSSGRRILLSPPLAGAAAARARLEGRDALTAALALVCNADAKEVGGQLEKSYGLGKATILEETIGEAAWDRYVAIFGRAAYTWTPADDARSLALTDAGDGHTVLTEPPPGLETHYVWVPFDRLVTDDMALSLVLRLLAGDGLPDSTDKRPRDDSARLTEPPATFPVLFPTAEDLVWSSMGAPIAADREQTTLRIRVIHGNLAGAHEKLIVGTQFGTPIGGAEKALDARLDGALSRHRLLGQYPGQRGTCQLFALPEKPGPSAAVIGLGDPGDLSPGDLTAGVAQAVLRLVADRQTHDAEELELATVLIGTVGPGALGVPSAVNAAITGVRRANRRIRDLGLPHAVKSLTIYELYEDRAIEALHAAIQLEPTSTSTDDDVLVIDKVLNEGTDSRAGTPRADYNADRWRTIRVSGMKPDKEGEPLRALTFTDTGRSAGASTLISVAQHKIIEAMIEQCVGSPSVDEQIYNTLYELLVPRSMKGQGLPSENIMYMLDEHAASLPFEMLATRSFDDRVVPIAIEVGLVRRLESSRIRDLIRPSPGRKALVIGDPYIGQGKRRLAGAVREANAVADLLESRGWEVRRLISRDAKDTRVDTQVVLNALFAHEYRIIHIAAHGEYDADHPERSGVCIGPDDFLTSAEFEQMQTTPDLVFLNCCHVGSGVGRPDHLASSVSRKLIDNGIRAVVAAGWAVDDAAASLFATRFYDRLMAGENLGAATLHARRQVYGEFKNTTNTWGAYQVYGEPAFQLGRQQRASATRDPNSRRGFREQLESIARRSMLASPDATGALESELEQVLKCGRKNGWIHGMEHQATGEAWRALGDYDRAILSYRAALEAGGTAAGFDVIAQLSTAHGHQGADLLRDRRNGWEEHFVKATELLRLWRNLAAPSQESKGHPQLLTAEANLARHGLWRYAAPGRERACLHAELVATAKKFADAADAYAAEAASAAGKDAQYTRLAAVVLEWLASVNDPASPHGTDDLRDGWVRRIQELKAAAASAPWSAAPFERTRVADADLALHVVTGAAGEETAAAYERVIAKGMSARERRTIVRWIELIQDCLPPDGNPGSERRASLAAIRAVLEP